MRITDKEIKSGVIVVGTAAVASAILYLISRRHKPEPEGYNCPYCGLTFSTYDELVQHVQSSHPGERIPIDIEWE